MTGVQQLGLNCIKESPLKKMVNTLYGMRCREELKKQNDEQNEQCISSREIVRLVDSGEKLLEETTEFIGACREFVEESSEMMENLNDLATKFNDILEDGYDIKIIKVPKGAKIDVTIINTDNSTEF